MSLALRDVRLVAEHLERDSARGRHSGAEFLRDHDIALRTFVLVKPPFQNEEEAGIWANRSIDFAFDSGATAVSLIPTRLGNGALEALASKNDFIPPALELVESVLDYG